ncbi:hypothetical protein Tcan_18522 [Toxocara canis]|uniref:Uncharacterized protein n=1 Tax=Toxocara canis TaxID=6265 RepID=A0A0B2W2T2_TOXCA|nr:hypothetical protein Tcan_18522 [Toxocara canis]
MEAAGRGSSTIWLVFQLGRLRSTKGFGGASVQLASPGRKRCRCEERLGACGAIRRAPARLPASSGHRWAAACSLARVLRGRRKARRRPGDVLPAAAMWKVRWEDPLRRLRGVARMRRAQDRDRWKNCQLHRWRER